jgi:multidrug efflux pump
VSIIGTFAVLQALGFSINTLTLFGMVLAIGIVVDDAIVVVENVERNIGNGLAPKAAAHQAMREVSGPIIAIALVLCAVFVPIAFLSGVTGQFFRQFAVTIAISTVISAINSLTLSPALAAVLLRAHGAPPDRFTRFLNALFGWVFRPFNRIFIGAAHAYAGGGERAIRHAPRMLAMYAVLIACTMVMFRAVPGGFIPTQDKLYLIGGLKLPEGASLDRTEAVVRTMSDMALSTEGVIDAVAFPGLNALQFSNTPNTGTIFFGLDSFDRRQRPAPEIVAELAGKTARASATASCKRPWTRWPVRYPRCPAWASRSRPIRPTCRSSRPKSIASGPRPRGLRSPIYSKPCRSTWVRPT